MIKNKSENQKGITLIALVITIIVMLILVGVTINIATDKGGIFDTAKNAAHKTTVEAEKEELLDYVYDINEIYNPRESEVDVDKLKAKLPEDKWEKSVADGILTVTNKKSQNKYTINIKGEIEEIKQSNSQQTKNEYGFYYNIPYGIGYQDSICQNLLTEENGIAWLEDYQGDSYTIKTEIDENELDFSSFMTLIVTKEDNKLRLIGNNDGNPIYAEFDIIEMTVDHIKVKNTNTKKQYNECYFTENGTVFNLDSEIAKDT